LGLCPRVLPRVPSLQVRVQELKAKMSRFEAERLGKNVKTFRFIQFSAAAKLLYTPS